MQKVREIKFYKTYFLGFYESQDEKTQEKIDYVLDLIRYKKLIPKKFFKMLSNAGGIYELRIKVNKGNIRVLSFFDDGNLVVLTNSFFKKTRKTPAREIRRAKKIKQEYFIEKHSI